MILNYPNCVDSEYSSYFNNLNLNYLFLQNKALSYGCCLLQD